MANLRINSNHKYLKINKPSPYGLVLIYLFKALGDGGIGSKMQVGLMKILIATKQTLLTELRGLYGAF